MELKYLNTFKTILESGSFRNAARQLNYTQSTMTFQMQQLEQELSVKLFEKIGRKMVITQAGKEVLPYVETILQATRQLENYGKDMQELTGTLKVVMPETLLTYRMQPVLKAFRQQAPGVRLSVQALNCYVIRDLLISGGADIGVHYDVGGYGTSMVTEQLADFSMALIASPDIDTACSDFVMKHQRMPVCLITNDPDSVFQNLFDHYLREQDIVLDGVLELGSIEAIKRSVTSNLGVAYLPRYVVEEELENGSLKELKTALSDKTISAICTYHKNKWISPAMELFIRLLNEKLVELN
ncbi:MAG: LysR family transcriptional regulator [Lacrimispora sphenoides]